MDEIVRRAYAPVGRPASALAGGPAAKKPPKVKPLYPKRNTVVHLLGEPVVLSTHFVLQLRNSFGCRGAKCEFCMAQIPAEDTAFVPVLYDRGADDGGRPIWEPAVLKLSVEKAYAQELRRGLAYRLTVEKKGAANRFTMKYCWHAEPPVPCFDAERVMKNVWYPGIFTEGVYLNPVFGQPTEAVTDLVAAKAEPRQTPEEMLAAMADEDLIRRHAELEKNGVWPQMLKLFEAEITARDLWRKVEDAKIRAELEAGKRPGYGSSTPGMKETMRREREKKGGPRTFGRDAEVPATEQAQKVLHDIANHFGNPLNGTDRREGAA